VKGAYWDTEVKRAQMQGLSGYPVYTRKCNTDVSYLACARKIIEAPDAFYGQFATHNAHTVASILERVKPGQPFEFQRLHGMGEDLYGEVTLAMGHPCRVYAPVGSHEDLLPYLVRRLLENGANTSFVNRIADSAIPVEAVVADPVQIASANAMAANPKIPLPRQLYADRKNSAGFAFADEAAAAPILAQIARHAARTDHRAAPLVDGKSLAARRSKRATRRPAARSGAWWRRMNAPWKRRSRPRCAHACRMPSRAPSRSSRRRSASKRSAHR
jgi:RHH-type proline utilization regulon transcriptional repressor/proline dehydrogenase/delta 1-pyrroline-5-carboxylate dehydrogenase